MSDNKDSQSDETFAARWNRRKQETLLNDDIPASAESAQLLPEDSASSEDATGPETSTPKTDAEMPNLESLNADDSYGDFLSKGVSDALRKKALKQLFHLSHFNITDKLDDYDDDYSVFEPLGDTISQHLKQWLDRDPENTHPKLEPDTTIAEPETLTPEQPATEEITAEQEIPEEEAAAEIDQKANKETNKKVEEEQSASPQNIEPGAEANTQKGINDDQAPQIVSTAHKNHTTSKT